MKPLDEVPLEFLAVYRVSPDFKNNLPGDSVPGGVLKVDSKVLGILKSTFDGVLPKGDKKQPFHFDFPPGKDRHNEVRNLLKSFVEGREAQRKTLSAEIARRLNGYIDNRVGDLLLTIGHGKTSTMTKTVLWVYPHEIPIQFRTKQGVPSIDEIEDAFSKKSNMRKAVFFETPLTIGRSDLLSGTIVDTTAGRNKGSSDYWLTKFLSGSIELLPNKGTATLIHALLKAQTAAGSPEEKVSVKSVYYGLLTKKYPPTTLNEVAAHLVGAAKDAYLSDIPKSTQSDARFPIDSDLVINKIRKKIFALTNGVEVHFPPGDNFDTAAFIEEHDSRRFLSIHEEIAEEYFK